MDDATQGLTALLSWSTDFNGSAYNLAGSIAAALLGVALIFVVPRLPAPAADDALWERG